MLHIDEFIGRLDSPRRAGQGYIVRCPCHDDRMQSLSVNTGDDGRILVKCHAGCNTVDILGSMGLTFQDILPEREVHAAKKSAKTPRTFVEAYDYTDEDGVLIYQVIRWQPKDFTQRKYDNQRGWVNNMDGVIRVLYRLPQVRAAVAEGETVFYVEGEKDVHALERLGVVATTHPGGSTAWKKSPRYAEELKNCTGLIVLPDNDTAGAEMARAIKQDLPHSVVLNLPGLPAKGDVSDWIAAGGTREQLLELAHGARERAETASQDAPQGAQAGVVGVIYGGSGGSGEGSVGDGCGSGGIIDGRHYRALGYNQKRYYFLPASTMQVAFYSAPELSIRANLYTIAPREYWDNAPEFEDCENAKGGRDYSAIADVLIQQCTEAGIYNNDLRRGKGAWIDGERTVLHSGKALTVDGVATRLLDLDSRYIYEARSGVGLNESAPLSDSDSQSFAALCAMPHWETPLYGQLLAGWVALAPICGTLKWRPHIWLNGPAGCGKTYIAQNLVGAALRGVVLQFAASTTEAGIRQKLASDALPVLFDEAEGDTKGARENLTKILELMRHSSSDSDAHITKGSAGGISTDFAIRSMFCMASIAHGINRRADESRTSVLSLKAPIKGEEARAHFAALADKVVEVCGKGIGSAMVGRACLHAQTIRANAETFAQALAVLRGGRRFGDQLGTLLAGYHSLMVPGLWSVSDAVDYVDGLDLDSLTPPESDRGIDEIQCLDYLLQQIIRVEISGTTSMMTVAECIGSVCESHMKDDSAQHRALNRIGIKVMDGGLLVAFSNTHDGLARIFNNSQWAGQWSVYLKRIEGAEVGQGNMRFAGSVSRYVSLPASVVI